jgi:hypothetical protein
MFLFVCAGGDWHFRTSVVGAVCVQVRDGGLAKSFQGSIVKKRRKKKLEGGLERFCKKT